MNWRRKNSSSSGLSSLSQAFPISWISKFKQMRTKSKLKSPKTKKPNSSLSPILPVSSRCSRFCYNGEVVGDNEAYWRISFGEEDFKGKNNRSVLKSVWYDSDDELEFPMSSCRSCRSNTVKVAAREDRQKLSNLSSNFRRTNQLDCEDREVIVVEKTPRRKVQRDRKVVNRKLRKLDRRILQDVCSDSGRESNEVSHLTTGLRKSQYISTPNSRNSEGRRRIDERDQDLATSNSEKLDQSLEEDEEEEEEGDSEQKTMKELKIKDFSSKSKKHRKSLYQSRELQKRRVKQGCKVRVNSPRTASKNEICKIKALEDMKKAKIKKGRGTDLESYAVEKNSSDPQKDFRDSMVEMIVEHGMRTPEELENLLACFLSLNSDEYHDAIVKVFRQLWFDLDNLCLGHDSHNDDQNLDY